LLRKRSSSLEGRARSAHNALSSLRAVESIEQQFTIRLKTERKRIAAEEAMKAQLLSATDLGSRSQEIAALQRAQRHSARKEFTARAEND